MSQVATHPGTVIAVGKDSVRVKIETLSACASCQAHSRCGFAEKKDTELDIDTRDAASFSVGQSVEVQVLESRGMLAVLLAYVVPSILLLAGLIALLQVCSELTAVLLTLGVVAVYYLVLYAFRHQLQNKFTFEIKQM